MSRESILQLRETIELLDSLRVRCSKLAKRCESLKQEKNAGSIITNYFKNRENEGSSTMTTLVELSKRTGLSEVEIDMVCRHRGLIK